MFSNTDVSVAFAVSIAALATVLYSEDSAITSSLSAEAFTVFSNTDVSVAFAVSIAVFATVL